MPKAVDVLCIGNAIVDVLASVEDDFLVTHGIPKGGMMLIGEERAESLRHAMGPAKIVSGGSAANTAVGLAGFGLEVAYMGKVRTDALGGLFTDDIRLNGVGFETTPSEDGPATARCYVLVTPDGQRTMNTYLGACQELGVGDVDEDLVRSARILFFEGYLWDPPGARVAIEHAARIVKGNGGRVAMTLSDGFCVDRYRDDFLRLIRTGIVDVVFANESELHALYKTADLETAVAALRAENVTAAVTLGASGSLAFERRSVSPVDAFPIDRLVDTTGAGDLYAAGFLAGLVRGRGPSTCAALGALAASHVIQHVGARPQARLADLAAEHGLSL